MFDNIFHFINLVDADTIYWFCAIAGSGMFLIQLFLMMSGFSSGEELDVGDEKAFKWLSIQAITGFLMMFGWAAITCQKEFAFSNLSTIAIATASGICTIYITNAIYKVASKLQSSGTIFSIDDAIGKEATVYQRIPKGGSGKVSLALHEITCEICAVAFDEEEVGAFTRVQIIKKKDDQTVVVVAI